MFKECYDILLKNNIWDDDLIILKKNLKKFALKNHPDKGGKKEVFQSVYDCKDLLEKDFEKFKQIAKGIDSEEDTWSYSSGSEYDPSETPKAKSKSKAKSKAKSTPKKQYTYTDIDFDTFIGKDCLSRKGWLLYELVSFCKILGLDSTGTKKVLCNRLYKFFNKQKKETKTESEPEESEMKKETDKQKEAEKENDDYKRELKRRKEFDDYIKELIEKENIRRKIFDENIVNKLNVDFEKFNIN